ncbi:hypothetical protein MKY59_22650 [Paenibacillus sp. FSL W8-0426]
MNMHNWNGLGPLKEMETTMKPDYQRKEEIIIIVLFMLLVIVLIYL